MKRLLAGLFLLCLVTGVNAAVYDWSYVFGTTSGAKLYGSFEGTASGDIVSNITNIQMVTTPLGLPTMEH